MENNNLLESLLDLEEEFYQEGYDLGAADGAQAGYTEGSVFAVEKGFEKFLELGRLYGKALVWSQRLADSQLSGKAESDGQNNGALESDHKQEELSLLDPAICKEMSSFSSSSRLAKNIEILLELVDPASLPMVNTEEAVNDVDERMKGAAVKAKLIQRALGEREDNSDIHPDAKDLPVSGDGTGSIEDITSPSALLGRSPNYRSPEAACSIAASLGTHSGTRLPRHTKPLRNIEMACLGKQGPGEGFQLPHPSKARPEDLESPRGNPRCMSGTDLAWNKSRDHPVYYSFLFSNYPRHLPMDDLQISLYSPPRDLLIGMKGCIWALLNPFETST
ncbi:hypothetical protein BDQ94DRAFT_162127 [Aspergillus welwitschiae]|uniref:Essential protein Yae1 N-terminal domain-containing protein n=1 Tax=Aspergillus welwitschiae TaxID=1341132 RepID=A0A3F3PR58_9EURO|nr:hypothetical protein BDQ94DRAFT_162127 [Aspergillus welwitschiae]RDH29427.1 hypothetical protein BDQ94DRAFT_162127 [Aspergillus welwitschiae]